MKAFAALILTIIIISAAFVASSTVSLNTPKVGVKEGDWIEYDINITGNPPAVHGNVTWMRIEVLQVEDTAFPVNLTLRFANGTENSSIWRFNFTEGNLEGWIIIPANLGPGNTFYDAYSKTDKNIMIQKQEQKTVLGADRIVTYANDTYRTKQWDKTTGVFIGSSEVFRNWSAYINASATNIWNSQVFGKNQTEFNKMIATILLLTILVSILAVIAFQKKRRKNYVE
jgi:hypothetical protein